MSIATSALAEGSIAASGGASANPVKTPPKRRTLARADLTALPEAR